MRQAQTYLNDYWFEEDAFKSWLSKATDKKQARCRLCRKDFELSNMVKKALLSHASCKIHSERYTKMKIFLNLQIRRKLLTIIQNLNQLKMKILVAQILLHM